MATTKPPVAYVPRPQPTMGADQLYLQQELANISQSIKTLLASIKSIEARLVAGGL